VSFAHANVWFAAARSTIPLALHGQVTQRLRLTEKHPGLDDVYVVALDSNQRIQVDGRVYDAMRLNQSINKRAWSRTIEVEGRPLDLDWSADFRGMAWAMPLLTIILVLYAGLAVRSGRVSTRKPLIANVDANSA
jgi:hypothetical protein